MTEEDRPTACRICGSTDVKRVGPIYHQSPALVGGVPIDLGGVQFHLLRCRACGFAFKDPPIPEDKLMACYQQVKESHWGADPDPHRRRFYDIREQVQQLKRPPGRILDIGCANGALLQHFQGWERFGVEPSLQARELAERRGIRVLGKTIDSVHETERFDVVLAIDVVEHLPDPMPFFRAAAAHLAPDGLFLVVTGDTDALTWRLEGSRYWYCSLPEHVSFYNEQCMNVIARESGLTRAAVRRASHARCTFSDRSVQLVKNAAFLVGFWGRGFGIPPLQAIFLRHHAPSWMPARDHIWVVNRRKDQPQLS